MKFPSFLFNFFIRIRNFLNFINIKNFIHFRIITLWNYILFNNFSILYPDIIILLLLNVSCVSINNFLIKNPQFLTLTDSYFIILIFNITVYLLFLFFFSRSTIYPHIKFSHFFWIFLNQQFLSSFSFLQLFQFLFQFSCQWQNICIMFIVLFFTIQTIL